MSDELELLYRALTTPLGIVVETEDPERLRQKLYAVRRGHPQLEVLSFIIPPLSSTELWIARGKEDEYAPPQGRP